MDLYFCPGQRKPYIDTIPQVGRESMIFGKPGKKELYNTFSAYFFLKRQKKNPQKSTPSGVETLQKRRHF